jgi:two-component system sensor histidine kinase TtrS
VLADLAQLAAGWPLALSLAAAVGARGLFEGRRRSALNEALHELRRPIQALALVPRGAQRTQAQSLDGSLRMATAALERLDREINGETAGAVRAPLRARPLVESAVERWKSRAALAGGSLRLSWTAADTAICGDSCEIAQALDNLIVNAIEHGGSRVVVSGARCSRGLRVSVVDSGRDSRPPSRRVSAAEAIARLSGRRRHGHGLRVVRRIAAAHGGSFELRRLEAGTEAALTLPALGGGAT